MWTKRWHRCQHLRNSWSEVMTCWKIGQLLIPWPTIGILPYKSLLQKLIVTWLWLLFSLEYFMSPLRWDLYFRTHPASMENSYTSSHSQTKLRLGTKFCISNKCADEKTPWEYLVQFLQTNSIIGSSQHGPFYNPCITWLRIRNPIDILF